MTGAEPAGLPRVSILLATYGGEAFLAEQLASLAAQAGVDWRLLWRDDGSADRTVPIMDAFAAAQPPGRVERLAEPAGRCGATRSFLALLAAAPDDGRLYAFCDQDDVWLPGKLARAADRLAATDGAIPTLYCARQQLVGPALEPRGLSPGLRRPPGFRNALVQNIATGCTIVLNARARGLILDSPPPPEGSLHDWWCYLLVTGAGGTVLWDDEPVILYRQHGANTVGASSSASTRLQRALRRGPGAFLSRMTTQARALEGARHLTEEAQLTLAAVRDLQSGSPVGRLAAWRKAGLYRQGRLEDLLLRAWIALGRPGSP